MSYGPTSEHNPSQPLYFGGGFRYDESRNRSVLAYVESLGHEVIEPLPDQEPGTQDPGFTLTAGGLSSVISWRQALRLAGNPSVESLSSNYQQGRASQLAEMLKNQGHTDIRAIFQSADALNGLKVMHAEPGLVGSAILAYPAGIIAQPRFLKAARGVIKSGWSSRSASPKTASENFEIEQNEKRLRSSRAASNFIVAASVALSDQSTLLHNIRSREDPPGVAIVLGTRDWMIRPERVISSIQSSADVDHILVTDRPHGIGGCKRELQSWLELFPLMERARAGRRAGELAVGSLTEKINFFGNIPSKRQREIMDIAAAVEEG